MPKMDWNELATTEEEGSKPAPAGTYVLKVESAKWGKSKDGAPQMVVIAAIDEGPFKGKKTWIYLTFDKGNPNSLSMARNYLKVWGFDFTSFGALEESQQQDALLGKRFEADLRVDNWQGRDSNKVKTLKRAVTGPGGGTSGGFAPPPAESGKGGGPVAPVNPIAPPKI